MGLLLTSWNDLKWLESESLEIIKVLPFTFYFILFPEFFKIYSLSWILYSFNFGYQNFKIYILVFKLLNYNYISFLLYRFVNWLQIYVVSISVSIRVVMFIVVGNLVGVFVGVTRIINFSWITSFAQNFSYKLSLFSSLY